MTEEKLNAVQRGFNTRDELKELKALPPQELLEGRRVAIIECTEEIPCNPCGHVCRINAIEKKSISAPGIVDWENCMGCTQCVAVCPGLSLFMQMIKDGKGYVTMPYELLPSPKVGQKAKLFDREGKKVGIGTIVNPTYQAKGDAYPRWVVTIEMDDEDLSYEVRAINIIEG
jgi:Fe-S-cluster-containing hydrogenase component 2